MDKYVILTPSICNVGGSEQYVRNKVKRLDKAGFKPYVISYTVDRIIIDDLNKYQHSIIPEMGLSPFIYTNHFVDYILQHIEILIDYSDGDRVFVESTEIFMCEWGELLAQRLKAPHVCIILQEKHEYPNYFKDFLIFKYERNELYGINSNSINQMLEKDNCEPRFVHAECGVTFEDIDNEVIDTLPQANHTIAAIGRLEKPYISKGVAGVIKFCKRHQDLAFNILLIGGGNKNSVSLIKNMVAPFNNIRLFITGYLYPLPKRILEIADVFFASAGSALLTIPYGLPTISMDIDGVPIGILNYTTTQVQIRDNDAYLDFDTYLEMILVEGFCNTHSPLGMEKSIKDRDYAKEFDRQLSFFYQDRKMEYFRFNNKVEYSKKEKVYRLLSTFLGGKLFFKVHRFLFNLIRNR